MTYYLYIKRQFYIDDETREVAGGNTIGIFTKEAMEEDKKQYYDIGREDIKKTISKLERIIENLIAERAPLLKQEQELLKDKANTKSERRALAKKIENIGWSIREHREAIDQWTDALKRKAICIEKGMAIKNVDYVEETIHFLPHEEHKRFSDVASKLLTSL